MLGVEEREFAGQSQKYYILELTRGGKSLVPITHLEHTGLRPLISANKARNLLKSMKEPLELDSSKSWKDRASKYNEGLKSGCADTYAAILQELMYRAKADKLSTTETKMLETARSYFISEVGQVLDMPVEKIDKTLCDAIAAIVPEDAIPKFGDDEDTEGDDEPEAEAEAEDQEEEDTPAAEEDVAETVKEKAGKKTKKAGDKKTAKKAAKKSTAKKKTGAKKSKKR